MAHARQIRLIRHSPDANRVETIPSGDPGEQARHLVEAYGTEVKEQPENLTWGTRPIDFVSGRAILSADRAVQPFIVCSAIERYSGLPWNHENVRERSALTEIVAALCRRRLDYPVDALRKALAILTTDETTWMLSIFPTQGFLRSVERCIAGNGIPPEIREELGRLYEKGWRKANYADERKALALLESILRGNDEQPASFDDADDWGYAARRVWEQLDERDRSNWTGLLRHAATANGTKLPQSWLKGATEQIQTIGQAESQEIVLTCLGLLRAPARPAEEQASNRSDRTYAWGRPTPTAVPTGGNGAILKGLAWFCSLFDDPVIAAAASDAAEVCFKTIPGFGPRAAKVGNACVAALGAMPGMRGVAQLQGLRQRVKQSTAIALIDATLNAIAQREGVRREDLDDLAVPTFDLIDGRQREQFGAYAAEIAVSAAYKIDLQWFGADGKPRKSEPAEVKREFGEELKAFKRTLNDLRNMLPAQSARIERLPIGDRSWTHGTWKERYLHHPLLSLLSRRLIWRFGEGERASLGAWLNGSIVDATDRPLVGLDDSTRVSLWNPIAADAATVEAWQDWLERHEVTQPFKQAHREIHVLTDAERTTGTYSNRFAGHILRQHQFHKLCQQRGWSYRLQGWFDDHSVPTFELPYWDLAVEYWVEPIVAGDESMSPSGVSLLVSTDQVRFRYLHQREPIPLTDVPPLVFSELMRDVDLFVAVCSVGNDPTWVDQGPEAHRTYWHSVAFSDELSAPARTRRIVLERLVPRLKIADRCEVTDRFLVVRGDLRTYKIHLGSGNILMEPNNQYLCIVPNRSSLVQDPGQTVFLPFEGDGQLAVILSKAFLLANDTAIADPTITRQIQP